MTERHIVVVEILDGGGNVHHVITEAQHAAWLADEGSSGQDRGSYSDEQDRDCYSATDEDGLLAYARGNGVEFDAWTAAAAHVAEMGGTIVDVIAAADEND